jgi:hypothetical protein
MLTITRHGTSGSAAGCGSGKGKSTAAWASASDVRARGCQATAGSGVVAGVGTAAGELSPTVAPATSAPSVRRTLFVPVALLRPEERPGR